jgi:hypothetical protein
MRQDGTTIRKRSRDAAALLFAPASAIYAGRMIALTGLTGL